MAENEDPKGKITTNTAARPAGLGGPAPAVKKAAELAAKPVEAAKPLETKAAETKPVAPVKVAASAPVKPAAKKVAPVARPAVAKAAAVKLPEAKAPEVKLPEAKPVVAKAPEAKAPALKGKLGPKPKIKTPAAAAPAKPEPVAPVVPAKAIVAEPVSKVAQDVKRAVETAPDQKAVTPNAAPKTAPNDKPAFAGLFATFMLEETTMDMNTNFAGFQNAVTDAQAKAKAAFEKSTAAFGDVSEFAKGNLEAAVESGKIWAEGVQGLGSEFVAESRTAFETITGDIKELAAAKSPTDFFKLQSDLVRKNFDTAVAYGSKNSEAMLKLVNDTFAPISGRVSIAVEKARSATSTSAF